MAWSYTGSFQRALQILNSVKEAGADAIGIHITNMQTYMTKDYKCLAGQTLSARDENTSDNLNVYECLDKINMKNEDWLRFDKEAHNMKVDIVAMCNDYESFLFSHNMNIRKYVIAASSFYELDFIEEIVEYNNEIIIRIGGANLQEIDDIVNFIFKVNPESKINLLTGIQLYPTPIDQLHIKSIQTLRERYKGKNITFGIADHIDGDYPYAKYLPALALPFGIGIIEKHITTNRLEKLEDYEAALGGEEFKVFVEYIRLAEIALGNGSLDYLINPQNEKYRLVLRKRIVAGKFIPKNTIITKDMLNYKRNDFGLELEYCNSLIGKKTKRDFQVDEGLTLNDVI